MCARGAIESVGFFFDYGRPSANIKPLYLHLARRGVNGLSITCRDLISLFLPGTDHMLSESLFFELVNESGPSTYFLSESTWF